MGGTSGVGIPTLYVSVSSSIREEASTAMVLAVTFAIGTVKKPGPHPKSTTTTLDPRLSFEMSRSGG